MFDCTRAPDGALPQPLTLAAVRSKSPVTRRLYRLDEAAELVGKTHSTVKNRASLWRLPLVRLATLTASPTRRSPFLVPAEVVR